MKFFLTIILIAFLSISCIISKSGRQSMKLEITQIDTTRDLYVFKTIGLGDAEIIVVAEKEKIADCEPFKRYILADSIHQTSTIKSGLTSDMIGFYLTYIDDIKIRNQGELVKIILNCNSFSN